MKKLLITVIFVLSGPLLTAQEFNALDSLRGGWHAARSCFDLLHYHLKLKVLPESQFIRGSNRWTCRGISPSSLIQADLHPDLQITAIKTSAGAARWTRTGSSVRVELPFKIVPSGNFWVEIFYEGQPHMALNPPWDGGFVWSKDSKGKPWIGVACEGDGASLWYPAKDHPMDEADSALLEYEVPQTIMAVGNGQFLGMEKSGDSTATYRYRVTYPINHYNITINAADYRSWTDTMRLPDSREVLPMSFYALPEDLDKAKAQWGGQAKKTLRALSEHFGDYPFRRDGYRLIQTPYLGMEHQSCISYGDQFRDNDFGFDFILVHETAHEWWGNQISSDDHADFWIHEAFATYAEALLLEKWQGKETALRYLQEQKKKIRNRSPMAGPRGVYFNDWDDSDVYYKGTWMLHSMRYALNNDKRWFSWLKSVGREIGFRPISADSFVTKASRSLGMDFRPMVSHYTRFLTWPNLEFSSQPDKGRELYKFRWISSAEGFSAAAPVNIDGSIIRVEPGTAEAVYENKKTLPVKKIEPQDDLFLFKMQFSRW